MHSNLTRYPVINPLNDPRSMSSHTWSTACFKSPNLNAKPKPKRQTQTPNLNAKPKRQTQTQNLNAKPKRKTPNANAKNLNAKPKRKTQNLNAKPKRQTQNAKPVLQTKCSPVDCPFLLFPGNKQKSNRPLAVLLDYQFASHLCAVPAAECIWVVAVIRPSIEVGSVRVDRAEQVLLTVRNDSSLFRLVLSAFACDVCVVN